MSINKDVALEIKEIFNKNTLSDLKRFLHKREGLNRANSYLIYLFYLVQSAGILTASVAAGNNDIYLLWSGIGLNMVASLIHVYEKINNSIMKKLMHDIKKIKEGNYIDEGEMIDVEQKSEKGSIANNNSASYNAPISIPIPIPIPNVNTPLLINVNQSMPNASSTNI